MKELPSKIKVGGRIYDVIIENNPDMIIDEEAVGFHNSRRLTITIAGHVHPLKQRETFLHELLHVVAHVGGIETTEEGITGIAGILFGVLQDNDLSCLSEKYEESYPNPGYGAPLLLSTKESIKFKKFLESEDLLRDQKAAEALYRAEEYSVLKEEVK